MMDDIQSMEVNGYLYTLDSPELVGIKFSQNIYVPTFSLVHGLAITPLRRGYSIYTLRWFIALSKAVLPAFLVIF